MVEVFKTNVRDEITASKIVQELAARLPHCEINFDLDDCDKILRIEGHRPEPNVVFELLNNKGLECEVL